MLSENDEVFLYKMMEYKCLNRNGACACASNEYIQKYRILYAEESSSIKFSYGY